MILAPLILFVFSLSVSGMPAGRKFLAFESESKSELLSPALPATTAAALGKREIVVDGHETLLQKRASHHRIMTIDDDDKYRQ